MRLSGKKSAYQCRRHRFDSGKSLGVGNGNSLQGSCPGNPMDREALWSTVHGISKPDSTEFTHTHTKLEQEDRKDTQSRKQYVKARKRKFLPKTRATTRLTVVFPAHYASTEHRVKNTDSRVRET